MVREGDSLDPQGVVSVRQMDCLEASQVDATDCICFSGWWYPSDVFDQKSGQPRNRPPEPFSDSALGAVVAKGNPRVGRRSTESRLFRWSSQSSGAFGWLSAYSRCYFAREQPLRTAKSGVIVVIG